MKYSRLLLVPAGMLLASAVSAFDFGGLSDPLDWYGGKRYDHPIGGYGLPLLGGYGSGYPGTGGYGDYGGYGGYGSGYPGTGG